MALLAANAGASSAVGPTSGGKVYAFNNLSTTPQTVVQANPQRATITFHNPSGVGVYVYTLQVQNTGNSAPTSPADTGLVPSPSALGGCWYVAPQWDRTFSGEVQKAWGAFSVSGTGNPLTVSESNT